MVKQPSPPRLTLATLPLALQEVQGEQAKEQFAMGNTPARSTYSALVTKVWRLAPEEGVGEGGEGASSTSSPRTTIVLRLDRRWGEKVVTVDGKSTGRSKRLSGVSGGKLG